MSHANATLTPITRLRLARLVVETGWTYAAASTMFMVSRRTAKKWADRYRAEGPAGMADRTSRPHHCPAKTPAAVVRRIVSLRWRHRLGPVQIAGRLGLPASTVHAVLVRCRINRLSRIDRVTGEPLRRYEHDHPGSLIHVDVTKFGNIPDGGGWRYVGKAQGDRNRAATVARTGTREAPATARCWAPRTCTPSSTTTPASPTPRSAPTRKPPPRSGCCTAPTAWFADRGVTVERVLSDNGSRLPSHAWREACAELGITPKRTRPYRPQTNGKIERFHRTLADGWAYARFYELRNRTPSSPARLAALLQSPPGPQRHRSPTTHHPTDQPAWTSHLAGRDAGVARRSGGDGRICPAPLE